MRKTRLTEVKPAAHNLPAKKRWALNLNPGVAQFVGHCSSKGKASGSIPNQGTGLRWGFGPLTLTPVRVYTIDVSPPLSLPPFPSV